MTEKEQSQTLTLLRHMQNEMETLASDGKTTIMVTVPGSNTKHVYSGHLAVSVCRSLARTFESERLAIVAKKKNNIIHL